MALINDNEDVCIVVSYTKNVQKNTAFPVALLHCYYVITQLLYYVCITLYSLSNKYC